MEINAWAVELQVKNKIFQYPQAQKRTKVTPLVADQPAIRNTLSPNGTIYPISTFPSKILISSGRSWCFSVAVQRSIR